MSHNETRERLSPAEEFKYAKLAMEWYGWGSPVGLGFGIVAIAAAAVLIRFAIHGV
ncbi:hypothetical protein LGH82_17785 [Mesorhizobium sp. PAMC28654]|uniref:hypothetical protein n=1 Tax=Mesorhizobium sp. PAMC28654 TaxID=2880934 RepID=UPI001D0A36EA|nr:hypothetical protein [Mesorhizobium sp. PAMC28654]UDL87064.1 hypothetical protein LGH82_17785 [Mesorhizobium sp. PAMC28654]